ncbi:MAG TPA: C-GCAxxG-C-C family protein [Polyangia bacterium]|nr:C-GCAxxG-C-C family protein [Polyangia bacterium]
MSTTKLAVEVFDSGLTCTEAVAVAGMKCLGRQNDLIPRIATGFGGGLSRTKSVCGALTGGVLVLSAAFGRDKLGDDRDVLVSKVQSLVEGFRARFGSDNCFTLTGLDFNDPAAQVTYRQRVHAQCRGYVEYVCDRLDELL